MNDTEPPDTASGDAVARPVQRPVRPHEPPQVAGKPDGYYFIGGCGDPQWCLVYLYDHPDFEGVRHIAYGAQDGGGLVPVFDVREDAELVPAVALSADLAMTLSDLRPNVGAKPQTPAAPT